MKNSLKDLIRILENHLLSIGGEKIISEKVKTYSLYKLNDDIFMSFSFNEKENFFDIRLGDLYLFKDVSERIIVLEEIDWYLYHLEEIDSSRNYLMLSYEDDIEWYIDVIIKELGFIMDNIYKLKDLCYKEIEDRKNKYGSKLIKKINGNWKEII